MIYLELFFSFLKIGCFSFGAASIPLVREAVLTNGWMSDESLSYLIAVSESTPGPLMVNLATYVGSVRGGILGSVIATLAVILPAFAVILIIVKLFRSAMDNRYVKAAMTSLTSCAVGIILAVGFYMTLENILPEMSFQLFDWKSLSVLVILAAILYGSEILFKKKISSVLLIILSAFLGIFLFGING